jgi:hypothetical protein
VRKGELRMEKLGRKRSPNSRKWKRIEKGKR